jgi:hypothetical protein
MAAFAVFAARFAVFSHVLQDPVGCLHSECSKNVCRKFKSTYSETPWRSSDERSMVMTWVKMRSGLGCYPWQSRQKS